MFFLIFIKVVVWGGLQVYQIRDSDTYYSPANFCEIFENTSFKDNFWATASILTT